MMDVVVTAMGVWDTMTAFDANYSAVSKEFHNAYGIEKTAASEDFVEAGREKVKELMAAKH